MKRFVEFNGLILKFSCYWDDQKSENGDINDYTILFYLEDNSMQIVEVRQPNSGKFYFSTLFKRNKLMKDWDKQYFKARAPNKDDKEYSNIEQLSYIFPNDSHKLHKYKIDEKDYELMIDTSYNRYFWECHLSFKHL